MTKSRPSALMRKIALLNYYRSSIQNAAQLQVLLIDFLKDAKEKDKKPIVWTADAKQAFMDCRNRISNATAIGYLSTSAKLILTPEFSDVAIGVLLEQPENSNTKNRFLF